MTVFVDAKTISQAAPIHLDLHITATLTKSVEDACRQVNQRLVPELGTGLVARDPQLVISDERIVWRVPIVLSLPGLGELGQVGAVDVDARSGEMLIDTAARERIVQHARHLYAGATLSAK